MKHLQNVGAASAVFSCRRVRALPQHQTGIRSRVCRVVGIRRNAGLAANAAVTGADRGLVRRNGQRGHETAEHQMHAGSVGIRLPCRSGASPSGLAADKRGAGQAKAPRDRAPAQSPPALVRAGNAGHIRLLKNPLDRRNGVSESKLPLRSPSLCVTFLRPGSGSAAGWHAEPSFSTACYAPRRR